MELLVLFIIGLLIAIIILPFVALAKANSAKRGVDDLVTRLSSLENDVRNLRPEVVPAPQPEVAVAAMEAVPIPVPITTAPIRARESIGAAANSRKIHQRSRSSNRNAAQTTD